MMLLRRFSSPFLANSTRSKLSSVGRKSQTGGLAIWIRPGLNAVTNPARMGIRTITLTRMMIR